MAPPAPRDVPVATTLSMRKRSSSSKPAGDAKAVDQAIARVVVGKANEGAIDGALVADLGDQVDQAIDSTTAWAEHYANSGLPPSGDAPDGGRPESTDAPSGALTPWASEPAAEKHEPAAAEKSGWRERLDAMCQPEESLPEPRSKLATLTKEERNAAFDRMDVNGNGGLSLAEIDKAVVESYPGYDHKPSLMRAYKAADRDGNGFVTRREFKKLLHFLVYFNDLWHTFESIDKDGDRRLTLEEFRNASVLVDHQLTADEALSEFRAMDEDDGGVVLFDEFCVWCAHRHIGDSFEYDDTDVVDSSAHYEVPDIYGGASTTACVDPSGEEKGEDAPEPAVDSDELVDEPAPEMIDSSLERAEADEAAEEAEEGQEEEAEEEDAAMPLPMESAKTGRSGGGGGGSRRRFSVALKSGEMEQFVQEIEAEDDGSEETGVEKLSVVCPDGCGPGDPLYVTTPSGQEVEVLVPEGIEPGDEFEVEVALADDSAPEAGAAGTGGAEMDPLVLQELRDLGIE